MPYSMSSSMAKFNAAGLSSFRSHIIISSWRFEDIFFGVFPITYGLSPPSFSSHFNGFFHPCHVSSLNRRQSVDHTIAGFSILSIINFRAFTLSVHNGTPSAINYPSEYSLSYIVSACLEWLQTLSMSRKIMLYPFSVIY